MCIVPSTFVQIFWDSKADCFVCNGEMLDEFRSIYFTRECGSLSIFLMSSFAIPYTGPVRPTYNTTSPMSTAGSLWTTTLFAGSQCIIATLQIQLAISSEGKFKK
jgi:hypothetical protein